ncbi:hypothetical protein MtrunA17_Chr2g0291281 [Medicago truncatula]|uniref:Uncharacterized protein n=1 Tax=Medicago truncatula TaxID=3880 RepID=A0A396J836_MEDTR|nr:hypothetical protein MtrunA17_Chr2g0291281 [Medicago truncatula]
MRMLSGKFAKIELKDQSQAFAGLAEAQKKMNLPLILQCFTLNLIFKNQSLQLQWLGTLFRHLEDYSTMSFEKRKSIEIWNFKK